MRARACLLLLVLALASDAHAQLRGDDCPCAAPARDEGTPPVEEPPLDLNQASEAALVALPGIGPARARAILAYRAERGGFRSVSQLLHIRGIGRAMLRKLRPRVTVGAAPGPREAHGGA